MIAMTENKYSENITLIEKSHNGDKDATEELFRLNGGLVKGIASRFCGRGTDLDDLVALGNMGLLKAIRTFDASRNCAFSTYAVPLIFGEIRRFLRDDGPIKVSRSQKRLGAMLMAEKEKLQSAGQERVKISELAERCNVSPEEAASALDSISPVSSLSDPVYGDEEGMSLEGTLYDEDENERMLNKIAISAAIDKLPELKRKIILLRYYRNFSQEETANALGLTQVKVSREEKKILAFFREELSE